ncbi:hypothetical protein CTI12_AA392140 [Artemisia annua]|uniref:Uncharacterized protein n=1 Tax=Artemisia annua TaxID=35608 RepID=A0A2U1MDE5_ARTAN|nr:hypothetical protein CTI12_AA392140 [Artemisia annua]
MPIPSELLNLADKNSKAYKEYIGRLNVSMESSKPSEPTPETNKELETSANLGLEKGSRIETTNQGGKRRRRILRLSDTQESGDTKDDTNVEKSHNTTGDKNDDSETTLSDNQENVGNDGNDGVEVDTTHREEVSKENRLESDTSMIIRSLEIPNLLNLGTPEQTNYASCVDTATSLPSDDPDSGNPEGERSSKRLRQTTHTTSLSQ